MILRHSSKVLLLAVYAYTVLFALTRASDNLFTSEAAGNETCVACPAGSHADDSEYCNCIHCECPHTDPHCNCSGYCESNSSCIQCEPGYHADKNASIICKECPLGTYFGAFGAVNCTKCEAGTYTNETGQVICTECAPGTNASHPGAKECSLCPLGYTCEGSGCKTCTACPVGHSSSDNRTSCEQCAIGTHSPKEGLPCDSCGRGLICDVLGCHECYPCPGGYQPLDGTSVTACEACKAGWHRKFGDGLFCKECPSGQYQEINGEEECIVCPEYYYCPNPTEKVECPDGAQCPRGSTAPIFCQNLFQYDNSKKICVAKPIFVGMIVLIFFFVILVVAVAILAIYCHIYRRRIMPKKLPDEKIPLAKEPVKEPVYDGH